MIEMHSRVWYNQGMKDGYYAQDSTSNMQVQDLLKILTEQIEKLYEKIKEKSRSNPKDRKHRAVVHNKPENKSRKVKAHERRRYLSRTNDFDSLLHEKDMPMVQRMNDKNR